MAEYKKALKLNPEYLPTYISIANTYMFQALTTKDRKYFKDSLRWFNKAAKLEPDNFRLSYAMGNLYLCMEQYDKAIEKLEYAVDKGTNHPEPANLLALAYNGKAYTLYKKGENLDQALELINKAIQLKPRDGIILSTKAEILYKLKRYEEAHRYIKEAMALEPDHEEIKQDLANIEAALNLDQPL